MQSLVSGSWRNNNGNNLNKKMKNNLNPKTNPITTILGAVLLTIGLGTFIMPMFLSVKEDLNIYLKSALTLGGFLCLLAPDALVGIVTDALKKFLSNKGNAALVLVVSSLFVVASCKTGEQRFNKLLKKGIEKGWVDTTRKDTAQKVFTNPIDTNGLYEKLKASIKETFSKPIYKDTCYDKKGAFIGQLVDEEKFSTEAVKHLNKKVVIPEILRCLKHPLFFEQNGITVEVKQDFTTGEFIVKAVADKIEITPPKEVYKTYWYDSICRWWTGFSLFLFLLIVLYSIWHLIK